MMKSERGWDGEDAAGQGSAQGAACDVSGDHSYTHTVCDACVGLPRVASCFPATVMTWSCGCAP